MSLMLILAVVIAGNDAGADVRVIAYRCVTKVC
jgi:hypothetical protein